MDHQAAINHPSSAPRDTPAELNNLLHRIQSASLPSKKEAASHETAPCNLPLAITYGM